ncbi:MAG: threonylcarbamoyl-AMP synthase [Bacteroidetes bacterium]|nr:threonylcarbamoyl-AMP synthase [Bacteroidota bacterium]
MEEDIYKSLEILKAGGVILYPTDTVWGLGCDATNPKAVEKIYKIKNRSESKSLIVLVDDEEKLNTYVDEVPEIAYDLIRSIHEPLTIIYTKAKNLAKNAMTKDKSIAIRIVRNEFCKRLISEFGKPIVSTSANISGGETPILFSKISQEILDGVDYVVSIEHNNINQLKQSTIIRLLDNSEYEIIRR